MAYDKPELLLVGAAQNLVLGGHDKAPGSMNWDTGLKAMSQTRYIPNHGGSGRTEV